MQRRTGHRVMQIFSSSKGRQCVGFGWVLGDVKRLKEPIPCKGALGLWTVGPRELRELRRQLPRLNLE